MKKTLIGKQNSNTIMSQSGKRSPRGFCGCGICACGKWRVSSDGSATDSRLMIDMIEPSYPQP
ncbi:hypothetical protein [Anaerophilus nitritogenes]|uniref:hypothetical protein n=1 Tax=Anaerophilus nitritogenes TaxID=2498136 RepID=UPI00101BAB30|nr:hypothetical protein [Anaerophilus nitritogenes]